MPELLSALRPGTDRPKDKHGHAHTHTDWHAHDHDHNHGHDHKHDHDHNHYHDHDHGHGHGQNHDLLQHEKRAGAGDHARTAHDHALDDASFGCAEHGACAHDHEGWRRYLPHTHSLETRLRADARSLTLAFTILAGAFGLQLVGSVLARSSVLAVEAVHSALDGLTVIISLISVLVAARRATPQFSYGFSRAEVLSALVSVIALALLCVKLFAGAVERLYHIARGSRAPIHVAGRVVFVAEGITLISNIFMAVVLARSGASLNIRALRAHVIADSIENIVVVGAGALMWAFPKASIIDPVLTLMIVCLIVVMNAGIVTETVTALLQGAPGGWDVSAISARTRKVEGVCGVRGMHVWTLTSGCVVGSVVVYVAEGTSFAEAEEVRRSVVDVFRDAGCADVTVQVCLNDGRASESEEESIERSFDSVDETEAMV